MCDPVVKGRDFFNRQDWTEAYNHLSTAHQERTLGPEDVDCLATAAYLLGRDAESSEYWTHAHNGFLERSDVERAVRCAFWLAFTLLNRREQARAAGWLSRCHRLLDEGTHDCAEQGYLLLPTAIQSAMQESNAEAHEFFGRAAEIGERFDERDLVALARHGQGRALIRLGNISEGMAFLDEAMVAVEAGELSPMAAGTIYCSVIEACHEIFDLRRAQAWTAALSRWCASQPDLVPYRGQCLIRRAEIMQLHGEWPDAMNEAQRASERLTRPPGEPAAGAAYYRQAELHRLRGEFAAAEEAYSQASKWGRKPQPGLAMLRLAQGRIDDAIAAMRREAGEAQSRAARSNVLPAYVEIMLGAADLEAARAGAEELLELAAAVDTPFLHAIAAHALGAVLLAEDDPRAALEALRRAWDLWEDVEAPHEAARVRVLIGQACRALHDEDTARMEFDAARWTFEQLGAAPDVARVDSLTGARGDRAGLTPRELEVLRLVAAGHTNKDVGAELFISERTVERHVSNIFGKLNVSSRTAATAYAYEHDLL